MRHALAVIVGVVLAGMAPPLPATPPSLAGTARSAAPPEVRRIDPPNWWIPHTWNPVRLCLHGRHLQGARVTVDRAGLALGPARVNAGGTYAFVDLHVQPGAEPGPVVLSIATHAGRTTAAFALDTPLGRDGRFQGFGPDDVIYLVMPDRFANGNQENDDPAESKGLFDRGKARYYHGGDLQGVIERLPYLKDLGVTAVWLNPVYDNHDRLARNETYGAGGFTDYHGFGPVDFYAVEEHFGTLETLGALVDAAHAHGMKIIQDQVANHTGPLHPWVADPPTPTWFNGTPREHFTNAFATRMLMDPRVPASVRKPTLDGWFAGLLPDLNQGDDDQAVYWIQNSLWWIGRTGFDGVRQDTLPYVPRDFWRRWTAALHAEYPRMTVVGEVLDGSAPFVSFFQKGRTHWDGVDSGIHTVFDYPLYYAIRRSFAGGETIRHVVDVLHEDWLYPDPSVLVTLLGSHDVDRFMHQPGATVEGLMLATTFLFTTRGTPQWYYGDEIAMPGGDDPDNRRPFPGGWPSDPRNAFDRTGRSADEQRVFEHVRRLLALRRDRPSLRQGRLVHLAIAEQTYAYARTTATSLVVVALNNDRVPRTIDVPVVPLGLGDGTAFEHRLQPGQLVVADGRLRVQLAARAGAVLDRR